MWVALWADLTAVSREGQWAVHWAVPRVYEWAAMRAASKVAWWVDQSVDPMAPSLAALKAFHWADS